MIKQGRKMAFCLLQILIVLLAAACSAGAKVELSERRLLSSGWKMTSSEMVKAETGEQLSSETYNDDTWYKAVVPGTVLGSLVSDGIVEDPYFGINMQKVDPGQFTIPWWFRTEFELTGEEAAKSVSLRFNGINYRADLWVNGKKVAGKETLAGAYRMFTFNIDDVKKEGKNIIALEIWQHADGEYSIGFVDWNPLPRDRNMGIFREVFVDINSGVTIESPFVFSEVNKETYDAAELHIRAELANRSAKDVKGTLRVDYELGSVEKKVSVGAGETLTCSFDPAEFSQLSVKNAELWWPNGMGNPKLYKLSAEFISDGKVTDRVEKKYGIREIKSYLNSNKDRAFEINGKFILLKGGGWTDDVLLQDTRSSVEAQLKYVRQMNMNSIRCEGFWGKDETLYDLCDEYGILVMIGWNCHWEWEEYLLKPVDEKYGGPVNNEDINLIAAYWKDQMLWLRNHPSIYVWMLGSDKLPAPELERKYIELFKKYDPSRSYITSAGGAGTDRGNVVAEVPVYSELSGPTGMKMLGPYAWTPPVYWFTDTLFGGAWGFNTETCPGASIPPLSSLKRMLPSESLWPIDKKYWEYHTGRNEFTSLNRDITALNKRYGESANIEEFSFKAQAMNYELMRPMFEAFIANKPVSTGLVQWKLNSAWPELIWQLYDTYLEPNGSFYGVRKACNPLHAIYRYGFNDIYLANEDLADANGLTVKIKVLDINSKVIFSDEWKGDIKTNTSELIYKLPEIKNLTDVWFLDLRIYRPDGKEADNNFYWLSVKPDVLDYRAADKLPWRYYTPVSSYADFTALAKLPQVKMEVKYSYSSDPTTGKVSVTVKNPSESIVFFVFMDLIDPSDKQPVLPVYWNDNYISLLPGEERSYNATFPLTSLKGGKPELDIQAWNSTTERLKSID